MVDGVAVATGIVRGSVKVWCPLISYDGVCVQSSVLRQCC